MTGDRLKDDKRLVTYSRDKSDRLSLHISFFLPFSFFSSPIAFLPFPPSFVPFLHFVVLVKMKGFRYARTVFGHWKWDIALQICKQILQIAYLGETNCYTAILGFSTYRKVLVRIQRLFLIIYFWLLWMNQNCFWKLKFSKGISTAHQWPIKVYFII